METATSLLVNEIHGHPVPENVRRREAVLLDPDYHGMNLNRENLDHSYHTQISPSESRCRTNSKGKGMIGSDGNVGDKPIRRHFNAIIFSVLGFIAVVLLIAMLIIHFKKPDAGSPPKGGTDQPITAPQPQ
jgi:hypothetical protein